MEKSKREKEVEKKIPIITIDLSKAWDTVSAIEITLEKLEKKLKGREAVFCVFEGKDPKKILDTRELFASTRNEILDDYSSAGSTGFYIGAAFEGKIESKADDDDDDDEILSRIVHIANYDEPAIAAYDTTKIKHAGATNRYTVVPGVTIRDAILVIGKFKHK